MDIVLIECFGDRRVLLCGGVLVYAEHVNDPTAWNATYDAEYMAEALVRAAGVGVRGHRVELPADFAVCDEDGPLPGFTAEDVRDWWVATCQAQAEGDAMGVPPSYPTLQEQLLGVIGFACLEITDEVRQLAAELEQMPLEGGHDRD
jgi:hypothetical protein